MNLEPTWTPTTDPNNKIEAKTISTVWFWEAWRIVVLAATKMIWKRDVPTTSEVGIPRRYIIAGTIINPPPIPINAARIPTITPIKIGNKIEIYNFDFLNLVLNGRPWSQLCWCSFPLETFPFLFRKTNLNDSDNIKPPIKVKKIT